MVEFTNWTIFLVVGYVIVVINGEKMVVAAGCLLCCCRVLHVGKKTNLRK